MAMSQTTKDVPRRALVNGRAMALDDASLAITDDGVARGDGAFETLGVWDGRAFALDAHLERLAASLERVLLPVPDLAVLHDEIATLLDGVEVDAALRVYVTASGTRVVTLDHQPKRAQPRHLVPHTAPWIRPLDEYGPAGAKTMSYLPNMVATRAARAAGGDDALLLSSDGIVLEGPTFAVYWTVGGTLHAADVRLGIVDSISRRIVLALARAAGHKVVEGAWPLAAIAAADEVMLSSAIRDVIAVSRVAGHSFEGPTPLRDELSAALAGARRALPTSVGTPEGRG